MPEAARFMLINYVPTARSFAMATKRSMRPTKSVSRMTSANAPQPHPKPPFPPQHQTSPGIDILVSNAAHQRRKKTLDEVTDHEFDLTFKTNVYAYFRLCRAALKHMGCGAAIIATSSER